MEFPDFTYESDVVDSKEAARLIALGAENIRGPWICLICGTPGRALHFTSYFNYRRHLVDVHNEKPVSNICEYCGLKSLKRNYLLHHLYTKHGVEPPPNYSFPKCNICSYVALTDAFLVKHKLSHSDSQHFRCTVCASSFSTSKLLLQHIQKTGHKYTGEKKPTPQCIYCFKFFSRDSNLYAHLKANHYQSAKNDGIIDDSDEEKTYTNRNHESVKTEPSSKYIELEIPTIDNHFENNSFQLEQNADGNIEIMTKKPRVSTPINRNKILNSGFSKPQPSNSNQKVNIIRNIVTKNDFLQSQVTSKKDEILLIDNNEYILQDFQLVPKLEQANASFLSDTYHTDPIETIPSISTTPDYSNIHTDSDQAKVILKKSSNINQPIQIVVSNEEEYKALLSSNHSIIFNHDETNKAMTVLTTPNTTAENTINLNDVQANDMMIIRENYPINITESNTNENSNIVVVYSHPVDDPNKHYQLITTSQSIEGQYVQSSAIITQNYETVTTTTPIIGSHEVINDTTVDNSWQNDIQVNSLPIVKTSEIQIISHTDATKVHEEDNSEMEINELPEVELTQPVVEEVHIPQQHIIEHLPNSETTVITQNNETGNINSEQNLTQGVTEVLPMTTFEATTISTVNTISTISNINEPIVVDSVKEVIIDNIDQQLDANREQQPDANKEQQLDVTIKDVEITDVSMEQEIETDTSNPQCSVITDPIVETLTVPCIEQNNIRTEVIIELQKVQCGSDVIEEQTTEKCKEISNTVEQGNKIQEVQCSSNVIEEQTTENYSEISNSMEQEDKQDDEETIENIARDIGVDPNTLVPTESVEVPFNNEINEKPPQNIEVPLNTDINEKPIIKEQIANLTSEWSEDEADIVAEPLNNTSEECNNVTQIETVEPIEIAISIETETNNEEDKPDNCVTLQENNLPIAEEANVCEPVSEKKNVTENTTVPQEKISSLLNDWEDNDSQEENNTEDITAIPTEVIKNTIDVVNESITSQQDPKPDIRNLVSDWDEDDEEENKG